MDRVIKGYNRAAAAAAATAATAAAAGRSEDAESVGEVSGE